MQLGAINTNKLGYVPENQNNFVQKDFDFTPMETRVKQLEDYQKYMMIALVLLALYTIFKNK
jgi:hypothetical protein